MTIRALVLTAAYPGPTEPLRAVFLENFHRAMLDEAGDDLEITVVAPRVYEADPARETRRGVEVRRFAYPSGGKRLKEHDKLPWLQLVVYLLSALWCVLWEARRGTYHVLVCHWVLPCGVVGRLARGVLGIPIVLWAHGTDIRRFVGKSALATALARWCARGASTVYAVSQDLATTMHCRMGVDTERLRVLPMGVADDFVAGSSERDRIGLDGRKHLLYVGDLSVAKGVRDLLAALRHLDHDDLDYELHVAGSGPLADEVDAADGVHRLGDVAPSDLAVWYRAVDLLVFASLSEGTPVVVLEALSSGLPVVATDVGGIPEILEDGVTGVVVPASRPEDLASAISALLHDAGRYRAMRDAISRDISRSGSNHSVRARSREFLPLLRGVAMGADA